MIRAGAVVAALMLQAGVANAQDATAANPSSVCWRFAFSSWAPPLDWAAAGHEGRAAELAARVQRVRDSVYVRDSVASRNNAMIWEETAQGWRVVLFPPWWPVGVKVEFDSVYAEGREMSGTATAFVADAGQTASRARAQARRCPA
jgi:hypothetical protein